MHLLQHLAGSGRPACRGRLLPREGVMFPPAVVPTGHIPQVGGEPSLRLPIESRLSEDPLCHPHRLEATR